MKLNTQTLLAELKKVPHPVKLVAVTKYFDVPTTQAVIQSGAKAIGENRVEKAMEKFPHLPPVEKHFIGQVQSKKIKAIVEHFEVIQSVGSNKHLLKIEEVAQSLHKKIEVFLQFNISDEAQKSGYGVGDLPEIEKVLSQLKWVQVVGLMGMASNTSDETLIRRQFTGLRELRDQFQVDHPQIKELSMGMSSDYKIAIEEGATVIRLGRGLIHSG